MERELWRMLYVLAKHLDNSSSGFRGQYTPAAIVGVLLWATLCDRPISWVCQRRHWPAELGFGGVPSQATMSRRLRSAPVLALLQAMESPLQQQQPASWCKIVDAKPLPVGGCSKDPDACWGRAARGLAKGYKVFAIWGRGAMPVAWRAGPMNASEQRVAEQMLPQLAGSGYLVGDRLYDADRLFRRALDCNHQLVTPRKYPLKLLAGELAARRDCARSNW